MHSAASRRSLYQVSLQALARSGHEVTGGQLELLVSQDTSYLDARRQGLQQQHRALVCALGAGFCVGASGAANLVEIHADTVV